MTLTTHHLLPFMALLAAAHAVSFFEVVVDEWEAWKVQHGKSYTDSTNDKFRMKVFMENKARIAKHNNHAARGRHDYFLGMNHHGDLLHQEFLQTVGGCYRADFRKEDNATHVGATFIPPAHVSMPDQVDWREMGAVTNVKNQGKCGSCWSFSATGALEGQNFRKTGKLVSLSEQNLVDCSSSYGNSGCDGGLMDNAFKYIKDNGGIDTESSYPYEGKYDTCRYRNNDKGAGDVGFTDVAPGDERALMQAVATVGPVSVAIDASHESFQFYSHGVYSEEACQDSNLDHGVLVVGYGKDAATGKAYWLVKNSWGTTWGEGGYIKMAKDASNMCGIASAASYPLV